MWVRWKEDLRPMPWQLPEVWQEAAIDPQLIKTREGKIIGSGVNLLGDWTLLVACTDDKIRSVDIRKVTILKEAL